MSCAHNVLMGQHCAGCGPGRRWTTKFHGEASLKFWPDHAIASDDHHRLSIKSHGWNKISSLEIVGIYYHQPEIIKNFVIGVILHSDVGGIVASYSFFLGHAIENVFETAAYLKMSRYTHLNGWIVLISWKITSDQVFMILLWETKSSRQALQKMIPWVASNWGLKWGQCTLDSTHKYLSKNDGCTNMDNRIYWYITRLICLDNFWALKTIEMWGFILGVMTIFAINTLPHGKHCHS